VVSSTNPGTDGWNPSFDNFVATNLTSVSKNHSQNSEVSLLPNPSNGSVTVYAPGFSNKASLEVFNILGSRVYSGNLNSGRAHLELGELRTGVYLVKITEGKQVAVSRLILK
jgi:hypothetical protein